MKKVKIVAVPVLGVLLGLQANAQSNPASQAARQWRQKHQQAILREFIDLLALPNIAGRRFDWAWTMQEETDWR